jgi:hypothetical protein
MHNGPEDASKGLLGTFFVQDTNDHNSPITYLAEWGELKGLGYSQARAIASVMNAFAAQNFRYDFRHVAEVLQLLQFPVEDNIAAWVVPDRFVEELVGVLIIAG